MANCSKTVLLVASFDTTTTSGQLVITFTDANGETPTNDDVNAIMQQIAYSNTNQSPPASVLIDWTFSDNNDGSQGSGGVLTANGSTTVNITAVNDAPVITGGPDAVSLTETNAGLTSTGDLTVTDIDTTDNVTASVDSVVVTGTGSSSVPTALTNTAIRDFLTVTPTAVLNDSENSATLTWDFNSGSEAFDFLAKDETLVLTYTVSATDDAGTPLSDTETVTVTITGTNDAPTVTVVDVDGAVVEDAATPNLTDNGSVAFDELDETDVITSSVAIKSTTTTGPAVPTDLATALNSALSINQTGSNDGTIDWDFSVGNESDAVSCCRRNRHRDLHDHRF